jgi:hypothetical protein
VIGAISAKLTVVLIFSKTYPNRLERKFITDGDGKLWLRLKWGLKFEMAVLEDVA